MYSLSRNHFYIQVLTSEVSNFLSRWAKTVQRSNEYRIVEDCRQELFYSLYFVVWVNLTYRNIFYFIIDFLFAAFSTHQLAW